MGKISKLLGVNNLIVVSLLSIMFFNLHGYWYVFAMLPIVYALFFKEIYRLVDKTFVLFFFFGVWYSIFATKLQTNEYFIFMMIFPMLYLVGKLLGATESENGIINILFIISLSMAILYMVSIFGDIAKYGFYAESRNLEIEGRGSDEEISATGIYSHLVLLTTFIASMFAGMPLKKKLIFAVFAILAFVVSIRIQSRTAVVIAIIVIILSTLITLKTIAVRNIIAVVASLGLLFFAFNYTLTNYKGELGVLDRFQEDDVETGGYRTELVADVINKLTESPWGGLEHMPYAHNLWIDCARVAGIVPMFILLLITILYIRSLWRIYKYKIDDSGCKDMIIVIGVVLLIYMNVEPILEGCPLLFAFFALFLGVMRGRALFVNNM